MRSRVSNKCALVYSSPEFTPSSFSCNCRILYHAIVRASSGTSCFRNTISVKISRYCLCKPRRRLEIFTALPFGFSTSVQMSFCKVSNNSGKLSDFPGGLLSSISLRRERRSLDSNSRNTNPCINNTKS